MSKILLVTNKDDGDIGAEVFNLRGPFFRDVLERVGGVYAEAHQDDVGVGVGEGPQSIVVLLTGRVPECELHLFAVHLDVGDVVLEHGGDVHLGELVLAEHNQQTSLATCAVTHNH